MIAGVTITVRCRRHFGATALSRPDALHAPFSQVNDGMFDVELASEMDWEPGTGPVYLRRLDDGRIWRADIAVTARPAAPGEAGAR